MRCFSYGCLCWNIYLKSKYQREWSIHFMIGDSVCPLAFLLQKQLSPISSSDATVLWRKEYSVTRSIAHTLVLHLNNTELKWKCHISVGLHVNPHPITVLQEHTTHSVFLLTTPRSLLSLLSSTRLKKGKVTAQLWVRSFYQLTWIWPIFSKDYITCN